jgi:hypothetical protein
LVYGHDQVLQEKRKKLAALQEQLQADPALAQEFKGDMDHLEMFLGYILPENTLLFLTQWALGRDVSVVKRLTRDKLREGGSMGEMASREAA